MGNWKVLRKTGTWPPVDTASSVYVALCNVVSEAKIGKTRLGRMRQILNVCGKIKKNVGGDAGISVLLQRSQKRAWLDGCRLNLVRTAIRQWARPTYQRCQRPLSMNNQCFGHTERRVPRWHKKTVNIHIPTMPSDKVESASTDETCTHQFTVALHLRLPSAFSGSIQLCMSTNQLDPALL